MKTVLEIQKRLKELGYDPGPLDGVRGRLTINAVKRYQQAMHLTVDGIVGPNTLRSLFGGPLVSEVFSPDAMPWLDEAKRLMGTAEVAGSKNNPVIMNWAEQLDVWYPSDDVAWCGLFVAHCMASSMPDEPLPSNPLGARNWATFGDKCDIIDAAVAVFWRGSPSGWLGHVGFVTGQTTSNIEIIGGNQSDKVSIIQMPKSRLLATRWPKTALKVDRQTFGSNAQMTNGNEA